MTKPNQCGLVAFICVAIIVCSIAMGFVGAWDILMNRCTMRVFLPIFITTVVAIGCFFGYVGVMYTDSDLRGDS